ncbi:MAG: ATP-binding cassette domain-containing protein [Planctomycetota bacterium]
MDLLSARELTFDFGGNPLLDRASFVIGEGERIGLLGRNGEGKSTLLRLLVGTLTPESGEVARKTGLRVALLDQRVPEETSGETFEVVASGAREHGARLKRHRELSDAAASGDPRALADLERVQAELESSGGWESQREIERVLARLRLDPAARFESLSAGRKRRVLLAKALVSEPDLLLLDEPTNHLDVDSILMLEELLPRLTATTLFVTHDRAFLERVATRIFDLDRGRISAWDCGYAKYLEYKQAALAAESEEMQRLDRKLADEEAWLRKGVRARRTRNEGRVRALKQLREERRLRREAPGRVSARIQEAERSGRIVIRARGVSFGFAGTDLIRDLSTTILRGDRIGIIGPNGVGKTTLLRLLLGELTPQRGQVDHGTRLEVAYFDQLGQQLDDSKTVAENVADGDHVVVGGRSQHVIGYLEGFLFSPTRARARLHTLSGGERSRVLLARLFARPSNVLVLDEPTNDLDTETLELLEETLLAYEGTILLVSHDRVFLDNVATGCLAFSTDGGVNEFAGGLSDWLRHTANLAAAPPADARVPRGSSPGRSGHRGASGTTPAVARLTYQEQRELEGLPARIESLEVEQRQLNEQLADPALYRDGRDQAGPLRRQLEELSNTLRTAYARWEALEERNS